MIHFRISQAYNAYPDVAGLGMVVCFGNGLTAIP